MEQYTLTMRQKRYYKSNVRFLSALAFMHDKLVCEKKIEAHGNEVKYVAPMKHFMASFSQKTKSLKKTCACSKI